jgi:hypothetical protein
MRFYEVLTQIIGLLALERRVSYQALKRRFDLDDAYLADLKAEIIDVHRLAVDQDGTMLVWTGGMSLDAPAAYGQAPALASTAVPHAAPTISWPISLLLAEVYKVCGQAEEGLRLLVETLAEVDKTGVRHLEAELYRLQGELLLAQSPDNHTAGEACLSQALTIARRQQAKARELRAATSLSRLWQQQGKQGKARQLLAELYSWFTEGFDTPDLQDARVLLDALAS